MLCLMRQFQHQLQGGEVTTTSSEASSDDAEESFPIAASLTTGTKARKAATKGELFSP